MVMDTVAEEHPFCICKELVPLLALLVSAIAPDYSLKDFSDTKIMFEILVEKDIRVRSVNTLEETIEDHYIRLLGRGRIA